MIGWPAIVDKPDGLMLATVVAHDTTLALVSQYRHLVQMSPTPVPGQRTAISAPRRTRRSRREQNDCIWGAVEVKRTVGHCRPAKGAASFGSPEGLAGRVVVPSPCRIPPPPRTPATRPSAPTQFVDRPECPRCRSKNSHVRAHESLIAGVSIARYCRSTSRLKKCPPGGSS